MLKTFALFATIVFVFVRAEAKNILEHEPARLNLNIQVITTPRGIKAWFLPSKSSSVIALSFAFKGGSLADPQEKEGTAYLAASLLMEGAGDLDKAAFAARLEDLAIKINYDVNQEAFSCTLQTLKENRAEAFRLLKLSLVQPQLTADAFKRTRDQLLILLKTVDHEPSFVAEKALQKLVFRDHLYSRPVVGTQSSVRAIMPEDIKAFLKERLALDNLVIGITGDCEPEEVQKWLDEIFGDLPTKSSSLEIKTPLISNTAKTLIINNDIPQSTIHLAQEGLSNSDPDYLKAILLTAILGGGSISRLNEEVREKRGLAYYVNASIESWGYGGWVHGTLGTMNKQVKEALTIVQQEWHRIHDKGVTADELMNAKMYLIGAFPLLMTKASDIANLLVGYQLANRTIDFLNDRNRRIANIQLNELNTFAQQFIKPETLKVVIVGQPEGMANETETENKNALQS